MAKHARRFGDGRHRLGMPELVHCRWHLNRPRNFVAAVLSSWLHIPRHSFRTLARAGGRPRPVLAIIASL